MQRLRTIHKQETTLNLCVLLAVTSLADSPRIGSLARTNVTHQPITVLRLDLRGTKLVILLSFAMLQSTSVCFLDLLLLSCEFPYVRKILFPVEGGALIGVTPHHLTKGKKKE